MCILRTDYMMDKVTKSLKLVEYNTIACSFGCLSQKVRNLQDYICHKYCKELPRNYGIECKCEESVKMNEMNERSYTDRLVDCFKQAIVLYQKSLEERGFTDIQSNPAVLFVVEDTERNVID